MVGVARALSAAGWRASIEIIITFFREAAFEATAHKHRINMYVNIFLFNFPDLPDKC